MALICLGEVRGMCAGKNAPEVDLQKSCAMHLALHVLSLADLPCMRALLCAQATHLAVLIEVLRPRGEEV